MFFRRNKLYRCCSSNTLSLYLLSQTCTWRSLKRASVVLVWYLSLLSYNAITVACLSTTFGVISSVYNRQRAISGSQGNSHHGQQLSRDKWAIFGRLRLSVPSLSLWGHFFMVWREVALQVAVDSPRNSRLLLQLNSGSEVERMQQTSWLLLLWHLCLLDGWKMGFVLRYCALNCTLANDAKMGILVPLLTFPYCSLPKSILWCGVKRREFFILC